MLTKKWLLYGPQRKRLYIGAGLRFCHPYTIKQLFQSIIIPRLSYCLEICDLTVTNIIDLNINTCSALKSLFNISKHGCILLPALDIEEFSQVLIRHKINLFTRLLNNATTRTIILNELSAMQSTFVRWIKSPSMNFFTQNECQKPFNDAHQLKSMKLTDWNYPLSYGDYQNNA